METLDYTIAAIPTMFRGVRYRSRLEARWASFFDKLGIEFEYEPFDLGPWSPDFLLKGDGSEGDILVEVKPITSFNNQISAKIEKAFLLQERPRWFPLLCGTAPIFPPPQPFVPELDKKNVILGWQMHSFKYSDEIYDYFGFIEWSEAMLAWTHHENVPNLIADVIFGCSKHKDWSCWRSTSEPYRSVFDRSSLPDEYFGYAEYTRKLWDEACDRVQWHPAGTAR